MISVVEGFACLLLLGGKISTDTGCAVDIDGRRAERNGLLKNTKEAQPTYLISRIEQSNKPLLTKYCTEYRVQQVFYESGNATYR